jgi:hypothetical protein
MDRIQAYGGSDDEADDEERQDEAKTVSEANGGGGARKRAAAERDEPTQPHEDERRRRRPQTRLPDAGALLDGRTTVSVATTATVAVPPPPPPLPEHQQQLGPPLHDGNFPFIVYVPVPPKGALADALAEIVTVAAPGVPGFEPLIGSGVGGVEAAPPPPSSSSSPPPDVPLHISLTRAGTVRLRQTALLVAALGRHLSKTKGKRDAAAAAGPPLQPPPSSSSKPIALLGRPRAFLNDDRTRSFLVLTALDPQDEPKTTPPTTTTRCAPALVRAIARCDAALRELGLPPYYSDGQPHVSLASAPASSHAAMEAAAEAVARRMTTLPLPPLTLPYPSAALCQIGKRRHVVWGEQETTT